MAFAERFELIVQSINNTELRNSITKLFDIIGVGNGDKRGSISLVGDITGDVTGDVTGNVTGNLTGDVTGDLTGDTILPGREDAEHGAGAIGTTFAPRTYRFERDGHIVTEIHIDLDGLAVKGDAAKDAIGLAAGGAAYIGRYVTATYGIVYKAEVICVEVPGEETATITTDIDVAVEATGAVEYDGTVATVLINTAALVAGEIVEKTNPGALLTANDYIYLVEGDTAASEGEYSGGQYILRFYGHAVIS